MNPARRGLAAWLVRHREDAVTAWLASDARDRARLVTSTRTARARRRLRFWDALLDLYTFGGRR